MAGREAGPMGRLVRSLAFKLLLAFAIFVAVPIVVYGQLEQADSQKATILLQSVREQGRLAAAALRPLLERAPDGAIAELGPELERLIRNQARARLLFRPADPGTAPGFFLIAATPPAPAAQLERERTELLAMGLLDRLPETCEGRLATALRYRNPAGTEEFLSSAVPVLTDGGCWVLVTSFRTDELIGATIARPYWEAPEVQWALAVYLLMALLVLSLFAGIRTSLRRFAALARAIRTGAGGGRSFLAQNQVPELDAVAREIDALVNALQASSRAMRDAAEDNAHAFKTPLAVISQSIEPLRRAVPPEDDRGRRALELIERSTARLDALVTAARRMDQAAAELVDVQREPMDLESFLRRMVAGYADRLLEHDITLVADTSGTCRVLASAELLETVLENVLENAISFSPPGGEIRVELGREKDQAVLRVSDQGPGAPASDLQRLFERYYSSRASGVDDSQHFGIGLWLVRRNVDALGGSVAAQNRPEGGLTMTVRVPLAA